MHILTHPVHTAWEYEFAKTGHEIFTVAPDDFEQVSDGGWGLAGATLVGGGGVWNAKSRPMPANVKVITYAEALSSSFDVCVVHTIPWLERLRSVSCPKILKIHTIPDADYIPEWAEEYISAITVNNEVVLEKVATQSGIFKKAIHVPIDPELFNGYIGDQKKCLASAHVIKIRPEKRQDRLDAIACHRGIDLLGGGNENIPYSIGEAQSLDELLFFLRHYAVYLEVADQVGMSCLEAMMTGMPIVLFPPENQQDLFKSGENCLLVEDTEEAVSAIRYLLDNPEQRKKIGDNARESVIDRFDSASFRSEWNKLLQKAIRESGPLYKKIIYRFTGK